VFIEVRYPVERLLEERRRTELMEITRVQSG
jgi:hypothetical protein